MKTIKARTTRAKSAIAGALVVGAITAGGALAATSPAVAETAAAPAKTASATNYVRVNNALLRAQPNTHSTKLDVANRGNGIDLYCYVEGSGGGGGEFVWFRAHFWGGHHTGYIRADLVTWNTYPSPYHC